MRAALPWIDAGFIHRLPADAAVAVADLEVLGFVVVRLDGAAIGDLPSLHLALAEAFGFPAWYGGNWDAFDECFDDLALPPRVAIVWTDADRLAAADPKAFAEAAVILRQHADVRLARGTQLELLVGRGATA